MTQNRSPRRSARAGKPSGGRRADGRGRAVQAL